VRTWVPGHPARNAGRKEEAPAGAGSAYAVDR
jgi:hypothetical protein